MPQLIDWISFSVSQGFIRKRKMWPSFTAATVESMSAWPESTMRTVSGAISFTRARKRAPFISGMRMSETTTANGPFDSISARPAAAPIRGLDVEPIAQLAANAIEHVGFVIDKQDSLLLMKAFPAAWARRLRATHSSDRCACAIRGTRDSGRARASARR